MHNILCIISGEVLEVRGEEEDEYRMSLEELKVDFNDENLEFEGLFYTVIAHGNAQSDKHMI